MFDGFASHHTGRIHGSGSQQLLKRVGLMVSTSTCFNVFSIFASARASLNRYLNRYLLLITSYYFLSVVFYRFFVFTFFLHRPLPRRHPHGPWLGVLVRIHTSDATHAQHVERNVLVDVFKHAKLCIKL